MRAKITANVLLLALLSCATSGCSMLFLGNLGYFTALGTRPGHLGAQVDVHAGAGIENFGAGASLRGKFGPSIQQVAAGGELYAIGGVPAFRVFGRAGMHLLQLENVDSSFGIGALSPYLVLGGAVGAGPLSLALSTGVEYDVRFTSQANQFYWFLQLGVGFAGSADARRVGSGVVDTLTPRSTQ